MAMQAEDSKEAALVDELQADAFTVLVQRGDVLDDVAFPGSRRHEAGSLFAGVGRLGRGRALAAGGEDQSQM